MVFTVLKSAYLSLLVLAGFYEHLRYFSAVQDYSSWPSSEIKVEDHLRPENQLFQPGQRTIATWQMQYVICDCKETSFPSNSVYTMKICESGHYHTLINSTAIHMFILSFLCIISFSLLYRAYELFAMEMLTDVIAHNGSTLSCRASNNLELCERFTVKCDTSLDSYLTLGNLEPNSSPNKYYNIKI